MGKWMPLGVTYILLAMVPVRKSREVPDLCGVYSVGATVEHQQLREGLESPEHAPNALGNDGALPRGVWAVDLREDDNVEKI